MKIMLGEKKEEKIQKNNWMRILDVMYIEQGWRNTRKKKSGGRTI